MKIDDFKKEYFVIVKFKTEYNLKKSYNYNIFLNNLFSIFEINRKSDILFKY